MRWLLALVILGFAASSAKADGITAKPGFTKLKDALAFLDTELDKKDWKGLSHAYFYKPQPNSYGTAWEYLRDVRGNTRLVDANTDKEFPSTEKFYNFSVTNDKVNLQFEKSGGKWYLEEIAGIK